jgi:hypothetical protein
MANILTYSCVTEVFKSMSRSDAAEVAACTFSQWGAVETLDVKAEMMRLA